jgi:hypothetical protein
MGVLGPVILPQPTSSMDMLDLEQLRSAGVGSTPSVVMLSGAIG